MFRTPRFHGKGHMFDPWSGDQDLACRPWCAGSKGRRLCTACRVGPVPGGLAWGRGALKPRELPLSHMRKGASQAAGALVRSKSS